MRHILSDVGNVKPHDIELFIEGAMTSIKVMRRDHYDSDDDGTVDRAEGVRDLDTLPTTPTEGEMAAKDGKLYVAVTTS